MATIQVVPSGNQWRVIKGSTTRSNHRKKKPAKEKAKMLATSGDELVIRRSDGTIQENKTVR